MQLINLPSVLLALLPLATASVVHRSLPRPAAIAERQPLITPSPSSWWPTKTYKKRAITSDISGGIHSALGSISSNVPSYVASGIPQWWEDLPTGSAVVSSLSLNDSQVQALPTQVLNIPYVSLSVYHCVCSLTATGGMATGPIRAGTFGSMVMSSSNLLSLNPGSTTSRMSSSSAPLYRLFRRRRLRRLGT